MGRLFQILRDLLIIRRVEFRIAEIPIIAMPALLLSPGLAAFQTQTFWEGVLLFFLLFAFGDMINCLADRDLDAQYKPHLSRAVYNLGVGFVTFQVIATAAFALLVAAHISWLLDRWQMLALTAAGLALGAAYSVEPLRLKGRGLAQLACLWAIIFVGPMLMVATLFDAWPGPGLVAFAMSYGAVQMGIILVNTAEDYPEDREAEVRTSIVTLGLTRGIGLASALTTAGALLLLATLGALYWARGVPWLWSVAAMLPVTGASVWLTSAIYRLYREVEAAPLATGIERVKTAAKWVPAWVTMMAWTTLASIAALFWWTVCYPPLA